MLKRYNRQMILPEIGITGQQKLLNARVLVVGAGGLGCPLLMYLTGAGIGHIGIIDHDLVEESNLHRQVLYHVKDIGQHKATVATEKMQLLNPDIQFSTYPFALSGENATSIIEQYDLVLDGSDNFPTRYLVNDTCMNLNKPLVFGSIFQFEGQVSVFGFKGGPDYRSIYPEPPAREDTTNCGEAGVIGTLPGIIGSLMANEAIKIICGFGEILSGSLLIFNALNSETQLFKFNVTTDGTNNESNDHLNLSTTSDEEDLKQNQLLRANTRTISMKELEDWKTDRPDHVLIDVREAYEFEEYNIGGINIPLYQLNDHLAEITHYKTIVFCCTMGKRSNIAIQLLKGNFKGELFSLTIK
uniref:HesA/MoeB/ThiF family protein n=1 Tax=Pedobacter schmidteae TaxID=2201271 RepID=UPI000EB57043|nr:HesA/MoeB/ThiF family protein [Pedobacter schmidteae]